MYVCMYIHTYDICIYISYTCMYTLILQGEDQWLNSLLETDEEIKKEVKNPAAVAEYCRIWLSVLQERSHEVDEAQVCTATHCNTLQHTATHCNTLQHTATQAVAEYCKIWLSVLQERAQEVGEAQVCAATHCNTLQRIATTQCKTLQHTATQPCNIWLTALQEEIPEVDEAQVYTET